MNRATEARVRTGKDKGSLPGLRLSVNRTTEARARTGW